MRTRSGAASKLTAAILGTSYAGLYPKIEFVPIDLLDIDGTAELLAKVNPTVIYNSTSLQSWWVVNELPPTVRDQLYKDHCGLGPWITMHLALVSRLMRAVQLSGIKTYVVNAAFPDVTNPSLARLGLEPTVGIGNIDLIIPYIKKAAGEMLGVPMQNVGVELIAHHYHAYHWCRAGDGYDAPNHLRVSVGGQDVTGELGDLRAFVAELPKRGRRPAGRHGQFVVAASSTKDILDIYNDTGAISHAPGPQGLEGGYPVRLSRKGAEVVLPKGMSCEEARAIMVKAQAWDGIAEIPGQRRRRADQGGARHLQTDAERGPAGSDSGGLVRAGQRAPREVRGIRSEARGGDPALADSTGQLWRLRRHEDARASSCQPLDERRDMMTLHRGAPRASALTPESLGIPGERERYAIRTRIVKQRVNTLLLPAMRQHGIDMWIILSREFNADPLLQDFGGGWAGVRSAYVFFDNGEETPDKLVLTSHELREELFSELYEQNLYGYSPEGLAPHLRRVVHKREPKRIGINTSVTLPMADGLTASLKQYLEDAIGPEYSGRLVQRGASARGTSAHRAFPRSSLSFAASANGQSRGAKRRSANA